MSGLSAIKGYEEGKEVEAEKPTTSTEGALATAKATSAGKGSRYATPAFTGDVPVSESVLENMQRLVAEKAAGQNSLVNTLKDTLAFFPGDPTLRSQSLNTRAQEREQESADIFNMRNALAQGQAAQTLAQNTAASLRQPGGAGGTGGAGGAGGTQMPPEVESEFNRLLGLGRTKDAEAWKQKWLAGDMAAMSKARYEAASNKQEPYFIKSLGKNIDLTPNEWIEFKATGKLPSGEVVSPQGSDKVAAPSTGAGAGPATTTPTVGSKPTPGSVSKNFSDDEIDRLVFRESSNDPYAINPSTKAIGHGQFLPETLAMLHKQGIKFDPFDKEQTRKAIGQYLDTLVGQTGSKEKALAAYGGFKTKDPTTYVNNVLNPSAPSGKTTAATSSAPTSPVGGAATVKNPVTGKAPENKAEYDQKIALDRLAQEENIKNRGKATSEEMAAAGKFISKLETEAEKADTIANTANRVIKHAQMYPNDFAYSKQGDVSSLLINIPKAIPHIGESASKGVEDIVETFAGKGAAGRRNMTNNDASKLGLDFAAEQFAGTGARLGVGLEQMAARAKGVGTEHTAESNILNATIIKIAAEKAAAQAEAWNKVKNTGMTPYEFMQSDENKAITAKYVKQLDSLEDQVRKVMPDFFKQGTPATKKEDHPGKSLLDKYPSKK